MQADPSSSVLEDFIASRPFRLDQFQLDGCRALNDGSSVLVCAPTGAGKTVVGEFAVAAALHRGGRCFYTTPLKALSNQKYDDFCAAYGQSEVGLLTGDQAINGDAPVVVMTTEVLRNMLYVRSTSLDGLASVVLDEVHYLADRFRGAVWEEVILHLPASVPIVGLSATVSNAEEFGAWIRQVRGDTVVIVDEVRPVPLWQHMMIDRRLYDLFETRTHTDSVAGTTDRSGAATTVINPSLLRAIDRAGQRSAGDWSEHRSRRPGRDRRPANDRRHGEGARSRPWRPTRRSDVVMQLDSAGLLPAIGFIFSRAGCDAAVGQCLRAGLVLTTDDERSAIRAVVREHTSELPREDLDVLGYSDWCAALDAGFAAHHAGLLPVFKRTVEALFQRGLVKMVFATETLALGINMPARTVVLERLIKYNGESHAMLTAGEYTQLTGRAGRRGIDVEGHAVVQWSPETDPETVAGLASTRTFPLHSSFRPTYNMAVNLVAEWGRSAARGLLEQSFAQFQADRGLSGLVRQRAAHEDSLRAMEGTFTCELGDVTDYLALQQRLAEREREAKRERSARRRAATRDDLAELRRGDVIVIPEGRRAGLAVVIDPGRRDDGTNRPLVCTERRWAGRISAGEFRGPVPVLGRLKIPKFVEHGNPKVRRDLAAALASSGIRPDRSRSTTPASEQAGETAALRDAVRTHPVHHCPDRDEHVRIARRYDALRREANALTARIEASRSSLGAELDRLLDLLTAEGYLVDDVPTDRGRILARVWSESDLVLVECLAQGLLRELPPDVLAGVVSTLVFESRRERPGASADLTGPLADGIAAVARVWSGITADESRAGITVSRELDTGFAAAIATWAAGGTLADSLLAADAGGVELAAGDFVRWARQVVDVLDQIRQAAPADLAPAAGSAVSAIRTGIVAFGAD